ncbi:LysR substrate-binding domain-containing protein [Amycolatopsis sp. NPDC003865]
MLDAARRTLAAAEQVRAAAGEVTATVRIGAAAGLTARLERGIDALRERAPEFDVVLVDLPAEARFNALRQGDLDLVLARGVVSVPGLVVLPAWTEPLLAVVSRHHPVADRDTVGLAELAGHPLRYPARRSDPLLHDAVAGALRDAGVCPGASRETGTIQDTVVEVGSDPRSWTVLPADQIAETRSTRVRAIPFAPSITIAGSVVVSEDTASRAAACAVAAFRDDHDGH